MGGGKPTWTSSKKPNTENTATLVTKEHRNQLEENPNIFVFTNTINMLLSSQLAFSYMSTAIIFRFCRKSFWHYKLNNLRKKDLNCLLLLLFFNLNVCIKSTLNRLYSVKQGQNVMWDRFSSTLQSCFYKNIFYSALTNDKNTLKAHMTAHLNKTSFFKRMPRKKNDIIQYSEDYFAVMCRERRQECQSVPQTRQSKTKSLLSHLIVPCHK